MLQSLPVKEVRYVDTRKQVIQQVVLKKCLPKLGGAFPYSFPFLKDDGVFRLSLYKGVISHGMLSILLKQVLF